VPIVLCDLESLTHEQAAATVGCPQRTLETRLYRGRERLRRRLVGRGLAPAVGLIGSALTAEARSVSVPTDWADSTALAVTRLVTGQAVATVVPAAVTSLIKEVNRAMFLNRLKWTATFAVITGLAAGLTLGLTRLTPGAGVQTNAKETRGGPSSSRQGPVGSEKKAKEGRETRPLARTADPARPAPTTAAITVSGRATDAVGKPVVGATIFLASTNVTDALLGTTTSDRDGKYTFREARLPVSRPQDDSPMSGTFAVYGRASGHGFAWHGMRFYLLQPRPAERLVSNEDYTIYQDEPMVMDLRFTAAATLSGRVMDEAGRPVPDAKIRVISCDFLDTEHKESHVNFREFWAIRTAPDAMTTTSTGRDGLFRLEGLPKEAGFRISVGHPDHAGLWLWAATTARPATAFNYPGQSIAPAQERPPVETGELTVTLHANRRIAVRTVYSDTGRPSPKVNVFAGQGAAGAAAGGTSDADGKLLLRLPPGQYNVTADPTDLSANFIRTRSTLRVTGEPAEQSLEVRVNPGCVLFLEVVDAKTGAGIPGVTFMYEMDDRPGARAVVQSRTGYIDNPRSDAKGRLRAVVDPGERVYALGQIPESAGYAQQSMQKRVTLPAGKTVTVRFALRK